MKELKFLIKKYSKFNFTSIFSSFLLLAIFGLTACPVEPYYRYETEYEPLLMNRTDLEASVEYVHSMAIENPGKIYHIDSLLLINEKYKGIHVINNKNPSSPINLGFINIPGCIDMAVKNNVLYADNAVDLVAVSINDLSNLTITKRIKNVFPELNPPDNGDIPLKYQADHRPDNTLIVEWMKINVN